ATLGSFMALNLTGIPLNLATAPPGLVQHPRSKPKKARRSGPFLRDFRDLQRNRRAPKVMYVDLNRHTQHHDQAEKKKNQFAKE
ncbi:MAG: hypothetical protein ACPGYL_04915, partial [Rhodospirillaceae bacterium]